MENEGTPAKLWGGRFQEGVSKISETISESISFDKVIYKQDIRASIAHARMLSRQKIVADDVIDKIVKGLGQIEGEIDQGKMNFDPALEDIHTHIEKRLVEIIGEEGKFLHTGRSRNDQVAVDTHLFLKENIVEQKELMIALLERLLQLAKDNAGTIWAGYTHTQIAQPVLLSHYLMSYFWMFQRDYNLLDFSLAETDTSPLGAAAMAGANYPIDREFVAKELGFSKVYNNSMDAVSTRDYQLSYHFFTVRLYLHISRMCEDFILYNSTEFSYISMGDSVTTGSSIMPQKKNPDIAELLRGKTGRVSGNMNALLVNLKGLPLTYNRDLQEDKIYLFDTVRQSALGILGMKEIISNVTFHPEKVVKNLRKGFAQATEIADYLVSDYKVPFRVAHEMSGKAVVFCEKEGKYLDELTQTDIESIWGAEYSLPEGMLKLENCIDRKQGTGCTSNKSVQEQFAKAEKILEAMKTEI
ncbi:MAG: argininosuccinate lyase [Leptospirales bacterium]